jgi:WD40 repeat protein
MNRAARCWRMIAILTAALCVVAGSTADDPPQSTQSKVEPVLIRPETISIAPGAPLSARALVTKPAPIRGVTSWSLEDRRHRGYIVAVALSPEGKRIATGGLDGTIRVWDLENGKLLRALIGHDSYVYGLSWSPDGNTIASAGSFDATVRLWDTRTGQPLRVFRGFREYLVHVAWSPNGKTLIAGGGESGILWKYDAARDIETHLFGAGKNIYAVAWSPDAKYVALGCRQMPVQVMDAAEEKVVKTLGAANQDVYGLAWSPDGRYLAAGTVVSTQLWEMPDGKPGPLLPPSSFVVWSPSGKLVATAAGNGGVQLWDLNSSRPTQIIPANATGVLWSRDEGTLIARTTTGISVWDIASAKSTRSFEVGAMSGGILLWYPGRPIITVKDGKNIVLSDQVTGKPIRTLEHSTAVTAAAWSKDGKTLAVATSDKTALLWETATGKVLQTLNGHTGAVQAVAWSPDGKSIATGGADKKICLWEVTSGKNLRTLEGHDGAVTVLAFAPIGETIASGSADRTVHLWNVAKGQSLKVLKDTGPLQALAWSPDGKLVASGGAEAIVRIWNATSGQLVQSLDSPGSPPYVSSLAFSPNGVVLASGRGNHTMQLWDARTWKVVYSMPTMAPVQSVAWTANGNIVSASSMDRTLRFWDAASGQQRGLVLADDKQLIAVSADGHYRGDNAEAELVYVVQADKTQDTLSPAEFANKYKWKNAPNTIRLTGN